jgi:hydroxylamine reductase (hybrid-cluster protein)
VASEANLGIMKEDMVNIVIHGHEPVLSEMIVAVAQTKEMEDDAKSKGAKGIQLSGICCTANEMLQRHGVPLCGTFLQQELAIITGACDAMVVDIQCIFQNLANVVKCFHTKLITTHPIARMEQENVLHIEFDEHHAQEDAKRIVKLAIDNFKNRGSEVMIPKQIQGKIKTMVPDFMDSWLIKLLSWADKFRRLGVWTNADNPEDVQRARTYGAEGIGLCRTEHMFFEARRLPYLHKMIMSDLPRRARR